MAPDFINGLFEFTGSAAVWANAVALYKDKGYKGVRLVPFLFFASWSLWNLFFYPYLHQPWSFSGGVSLLLANVTQAALMVRYGRIV